MNGPSLSVLFVFSVLVCSSLGQDCTEDAVNQCMEPLMAYVDGLPTSGQQIVSFDEDELTEVCRLLGEMESCLEEFKGDCDDSETRLYESVESAYLYTCEAFVWEGFEANNVCFLKDSLNEQATECKTDFESEDWAGQLASAASAEDADSVKKAGCQSANDFFRCLTEALYEEDIAEDCLEEGIMYQLEFAKKNMMSNLEVFECTIEEQCSEGRVKRCRDVFDKAYNKDGKALAVRTPEETDAVCEAYGGLLTCLDPFISKCEDDEVNQIKGLGAVYEYLCEQGGRDIYESQVSCLTEELQEAAAACQSNGMGKLGAVEWELAYTSPSTERVTELLINYCSYLIDDLLDCTRYGVKDACGEEMADFQYTIDSLYWTPIVAHLGCDVNRCSAGRFTRCYELLPEVEGLPMRSAEEMDDICQAYADLEECMEPIVSTCDADGKNFFQGSRLQREYICEDGGKHVYLEHASCLDNDELQAKVRECQTDGHDRLNEIEPGLKTGDPDIFNEYCTALVDGVLDCVRLAIEDSGCDPEMATYQYQQEYSFWKPILAPIGCNPLMDYCTEARIEQCLMPFLMVYGKFDQLMPATSLEELDNVCEAYAGNKECREPLDSSCYWEWRDKSHGYDNAAKYFCLDESKEVYLSHGACLNETTRAAVDICRNTANPLFGDIESRVPDVKNQEEVDAIRQELCNVAEDMINCFHDTLEVYCDEAMANYRYQMDLGYWHPVMQGFGCNNEILEDGQFEEQCSEGRVKRCRDVFDKVYNKDGKTLAVRTPAETDAVCEAYGDLMTCLDPFISKCEDDVVNEIKGVGAVYEYLCEQGGREVYERHVSCLTDELQPAAAACHWNGMGKLNAIEWELDNTSPSKEREQELAINYCS